ncbi:MAG TPA: hypothetical protein VFR37_10425 [Longimicrobium sp.]|nr:hypothetical protein [Longimicrobium sp.]
MAHGIQRFRSALFALGVTAALGFGANAAAAAPGELAVARIFCPGFTPSAAECDDLCASYMTTRFSWSPSTGRCCCNHPS